MIDYDKLISAVQEETTSADIAFLPSGFKSKRKKEVPDLDLDEPDTKVKKVTDAELEEAVNVELSAAIKQLMKAIDRKFASKSIYMIDSRANAYKRYFGRRGYTSGTSVLVRYESKRNDIRKLKNRIKQSYKDLGNIEMLTEALSNDGQLANFAEFNKSDWLYGVNILSRFGGVSLRFESYLDMNSLLMERITIYDKSTCERLEDYKRFKVSPFGVVSPVGTFAVSDFKIILNAIKDDENTDDENAEQEDTRKNRRS